MQYDTYSSDYKFYDIIQVLKDDTKSREAPWSERVTSETTRVLDIQRSSFATVCDRLRPQYSNLIC